MVSKIWADSEGMNLNDRLIQCGKELQKWGNKVQSSFATRIKEIKNKILSLRTDSHSNSLDELTSIVHEYQKLLQQKRTFWRQRAKLYWL